MKLRFFLALTVLLLGSQLVVARSISDIPAAKEALLRIVSPKFYRSLVISPIEGWVVVRGTLMNDHLAGARIARSDLGGSYDCLALELANNLQIVDYTRVERSGPAPTVLVDLLVYKIADGTMAMSFAHFDEPGGDQMAYYGCAKLAVLKSDGRWTQIDGPASLGTAWTVKQGPKNTSDTLKMETMAKAAESTNMGAGSR